jgi:hypothetical protein
MLKEYRTTFGIPSFIVGQSSISYDAVLVIL